MSRFLTCDGPLGDLRYGRALTFDAADHSGAPVLATARDCLAEVLVLGTVLCQHVDVKELGGEVHPGQRTD